MAAPRADLGLSLLVITTLFAVIFKILPDAVIDWNDVWVGALMTAVLFIAGRYAIAFYLTTRHPRQCTARRGRSC